jgi:hypothetical protein
MELLVARTDDTAAAVVGIRAYPAGFALTLSLRVRHLSIREQQLFPTLLDHGPFDDDPVPEEFLRFGVQFADGPKATNLDCRQPGRLPLCANGRPEASRSRGRRRTPA